MASGQRFAVQLQARRRTGFSMILQSPCGGIASCNGMFDSAWEAQAPPSPSFSSSSNVRYEGYIKHRLHA